MRKGSPRFLDQAINFSGYGRKKAADCGINLGGNTGIYIYTEIGNGGNIVMSIQSRWRSRICVILSVLWILMMGTLAFAAEKIPFASQVSSLIVLKVLPAKDWQATNPVTHKDFMSYGEKLVNGRAETPIFTNTLVDTVAGASENTTYGQAMSYAAQLMGYQSGEGEVLVKALTPEDRKSVV